MIIDNRLKKLEGKKLVIISKLHPHFEEVGVGEAFEEIKTGGMGLRIKLNNGEECYVFSKAELQLLINDKETSMTIEDIIEDLAACNYSPEQIADYLEVPRDVFLKKWYDKTSKERFHYDKGQLTADFEINQKQLDNAKSGNITAAQVYFKNADARKVDDLKKQVFYGFEEPITPTENAAQRLKEQN